MYVNRPIASLSLPPPPLHVQLMVCLPPTLSVSPTPVSMISASYTAYTPIESKQENWCPQQTTFCHRISEAWFSVLRLCDYILVCRWKIVGGLELVWNEIQERFFIPRQLKEVHLFRSQGHNGEPAELAPTCSQLHREVEHQGNRSEFDHFVH